MAILLELLQVEVVMEGLTNHYRDSQPPESMIPKRLRLQPSGLDIHIHPGFDSKGSMKFLDVQCE